MQNRRFVRVVAGTLVFGALGCNARAPYFHPETGSEETGGAGGAGGSTTDLLLPFPPAECPGVCVRAASVPFERVTIFSIGSPDEIRPCSDAGTVEGFIGYRDMTVAPSTCPTCACGPAACTLPEAMHASAATCPGDAAIATPFDAPAGWEGTCTPENAIPKDLQCGDQGDCVASLTIAAPTVAPCEPLTTGTPDIPEPSFGTVAQECLIQPTPDGCDLGESCIPKLPDGFRACLFLAGDDPSYACPEKIYTERLVVFGKQDSRACEPCGCGDAAGASCSALVSVFGDDACGSLLGSFPVTAQQSEGCFDIPPGAALGSKEAKWTTDKLGTCPPSGGKATGTLALGGPVTLCCRPEASPAP